MRSNFDDVGDFQEKFGLDNVTHRRPGVRAIDEEILAFRVKFLYEELKEFEDAFADKNVVEMFDALLDLVYVAMGTAHLMGFPWQRGWDEVQRANMSKERAQPDGSDSKRLSQFDVIKPEGWQPPNLERVINATIIVCLSCQRDLSVEGNTLAVPSSVRPETDVYCVCGRWIGAFATK